MAKAAGPRSLSGTRISAPFAEPGLRAWKPRAVEPVPPAATVRVNHATTNFQGAVRAVHAGPVPAAESRSGVRSGDGRHRGVPVDIQPDGFLKRRSPPTRGAGQRRSGPAGLGVLPADAGVLNAKLDVPFGPLPPDVRGRPLLGSAAPGRPPRTCPHRPVTGGPACRRRGAMRGALSVLTGRLGGIGHPTTSRPLPRPPATRPD